MGVTGYEARMYADIHRIAQALERIARAVESQAYGASLENVQETKRAVDEDLARTLRSDKEDTP